MMSKLSLVHMVRSAKLVMVGTLPSQCSDGRFHSQVCHFSRLGPELDPAASTAFGRTEGKMGDLLMNSAMPSEGSMRTSWPALRNGCYANQRGYQ